MSFLDLRKYFFSYIYILSGLVFIYADLNISIIDFLNNDYLTETLQIKRENLMISYIFYGFIYIFCCAFLTIEIILRELIIKKFFTNLSFSFNINITNKLKKFISIIFYILFGIASIPLFIFIFKNLNLH